MRIAGPIALGPFGDDLLQLRFGLWIKFRVPQPEAIGIGVFDFVARRGNLDLLDQRQPVGVGLVGGGGRRRRGGRADRSEEQTSELPVPNAHLVCRLLLEKKKIDNNNKRIKQTYTR